MHNFSLWHREVYLSQFISLIYDDVIDMGIKLPTGVVCKKSDEFYRYLRNKKTTKDDRDIVLNEFVMKAAELCNLPVATVSVYIPILRNFKSSNQHLHSDVVKTKVLEYINSFDTKDPSENELKEAFLPFINVVNIYETEADIPL